MHLPFGITKRRKGLQLFFWDDLFTNVKLVNRGDKSVHINLGDAFAQGIFMEYGITEDDRVETFRNGGFGSTDKNK